MDGNRPRGRAPERSRSRSPRDAEDRRDERHNRRGPGGFDGDRRRSGAHQPPPPYQDNRRQHDSGYYHRGEGAGQRPGSQGNRGNQPIGGNVHGGANDDNQTHSGGGQGGTGFGQRESGGNEGNRGGGGRGRGRGGSRGGGYSKPGKPQKPDKKPGTTELLANYFEVLTRPNSALYQYRVDFEPTVESRKLRIALLYQHEALFENKRAFDGQELFTPIRLPDDITEVRSVKRFDQQEVKILIKFTKHVQPHEQEYFRIFNIAIKRCLNYCNLIEFGRDRAYFDFNRLYTIGNHLKIAHGYKISMDRYDNRVLLCTEVAHKLMKDDTVLDLIEKLNRNANGDIAVWKEQCFRNLVGQTVITSYNNKTYRIDDINWDQKPIDVFEKRGQPISFVDYFMSQYRTRIRNTDQPLLVSLPKEKDRSKPQKGPDGEDLPARDRHVMLVPELCVMTGALLVADLKRNDPIRKEISNRTKLNPEGRRLKLHELITKLKSERRAAEDLDKWQIDFSPELISLNGHVLDNIELHFGKGSKDKQTEHGWDETMKKSALWLTPEVSRWCLIFQCNDATVNNMINQLQSVSRAMSFSVGTPELRKIPDSLGGGMAFVRAIAQAVEDTRPQLVVCILPTKAKDIYDAIKRKCCTEYGVPSQVVISENIDPNNFKTTSVITKIAIQISCKLGGAPWALEIPITNIMFIGMDTFKDTSSSGGDGRRSVSAFVASMDGTQNPTNKLSCTRYLSKTHIQPIGQEFGCLKIFMKDALDKFKINNGYYPTRVMIYRDGLSYGQFSYAREFEVKLVKESFQEIDPNYCPKLSYIVVTKRSNSRFFWRSQHNDYTNPPMGTLIDNTITKDSGKEFYLISQSTNQGTVTPTHYHMLHDESEWEVLRIQTLTFKMTHLYYNWPGQIRVPALCQYARKLATLTGESLHRQHSPRLDDTLFYL